MKISFATSLIPSFLLTYVDSEVMSEKEHSEECVTVKPMEYTIDDSVKENRIWRKLDLYILPLASMFYFLSFLVITSLIFNPFTDSLTLIGSSQYFKCSCRRFAD